VNGIDSYLIDIYFTCRNKGTKTVEEELLLALKSKNLITDEGFDQIQTMHFQRAARTDKGVSALRQIISLLLRKLFLLLNTLFMLMNVFWNTYFFFVKHKLFYYNDRYNLILYII